jgi:AcrR family transcriptional regulator
LDKRTIRGTATRRQIVEAATRLFAAGGFAETSVEDVLREVEVSRGALYHHFANKEALFRAVLEEMEIRLRETLERAAAGAGNPLDALRLGCSAWLQAALAPEFRQIALIDAPSVIGWTAWREVDARHGLGLIQQALGIGAQMGRVPAPLVETYAHMLLAALVEFALVIAQADDRAGALERSRSAIEVLLGGMFGVEPGGSF